MTWYTQSFISMTDLVKFMNDNTLAAANVLPIFQDNNGKYVLVYQA